jgi:hypothetical protein
LSFSAFPALTAAFSKIVCCIAGLFDKIGTRSRGIGVFILKVLPNFLKSFNFASLLFLAFGASQQGLETLSYQL